MNIFNKISGTSEPFKSTYDKMFNELLYPGYFLRKEMKIFFFDSFENLGRLIKRMARHKQSKYLFAKGYSYLEASGPSFFQTEFTEYFSITDDNLYEPMNHSQDMGALYFDDSEQWSIYVVEDFYFEKNSANFRHGIFLFFEPELQVVIEDYLIGRDHVEKIISVTEPAYKYFNNISIGSKLEVVQLFNSCWQ